MELGLAYAAQHEDEAARREMEEAVRLRPDFIRAKQELARLDATARSITRADESVLKRNLLTLRAAIESNTYDKQKAPKSLQDLVSEGYLRTIPMDPISKSNRTWRTIMEDANKSVNQSEPGIFDVKSGSDQISLDGTPYADW